MNPMPGNVSSGSISSLLPYWKMAGDYMLHVDGRITGGFELRGRSLECLSVEALGRLNHQLKLFLHALPVGADFQFLYQIKPLSPILSQYEQDTQFCPEHLKTIWEEKGEYFRAHSNVWHTRLFVFLTLEKEETTAKSFLTGILDSFRKTHISRVLQDNVVWVDRRYAEMHRAMSDLKGALDLLEINAVPLARTEFIDLIYERLNPSRAEQVPLNHKDLVTAWPDAKTIREEVVFSSLQVHPRYMILDDRIHRVFSLKDIPQTQYPGIINKLLTVRDFPFQISVGLRLDSPEATLSTLKRSENMQSNLQKGRARNYEAEQNQHVISEVIQGIVRGDMKVFQLSFAIHYWGRNEEELERIEAQLRQEIKQMGEAAELREDFNYPDLFIATLPGGSYANFRKLNTITPQTISLLPLYQTSVGASRPVALFKSRTHEIVAVDPFNQKPTAFNAIIFGPTGRGKSFLAQYLLLQYLRVNPKIIIVDIGGSYRRFTSLIGGQYVELTHDAAFSLNPFLPREKDPEPELIGFLAGIIERMIKNEDERSIDKIWQHLIRQSIKSLYRERRYPLNLDGFRKLLEERSKDLEDPKDRDICLLLSKRLALWTEGEGRGLLTGAQSISLDSPVITVDLAGLSSNRELQGIVIQILTGLIWNQVRTISGPKLIVFDEVWQHLKDPTAAQLIDQLYRTARKHYTAVYSISQQLEDFLSHDIQTSIVANSANRFILRTDRELSQLKQVFQLNDVELELVQSLSMRRGYFSEVFATIGDDHSVLVIEPSPSEYWLCTTHPQDLLEEKNFIEANPEMSLIDRIAALAKTYPRGVQ